MPTIGRSLQRGVTAMALSEIDQTGMISRKRATRWIWLLATVVAVASPCAAVAQNSADRIFYTKQPVFRIPYEVEAGERPPQDVELLVSEDLGQSWRKAGRPDAGERGFTYKASRDGVYWFSVQTTDFQGRVRPPTLQRVPPQLKVVVDSQPPVVNLRQRGARDGVAVEWDIREEYLDPTSLVLEYKLPRTMDWIPLIVEPGLTGERQWSPGSTGALEVRLRVRDMAKNDGERTITVMPGSNDFRQPNYPSDGDGRGSNTPLAGTRFVNSKTFNLKYKLQDVGPSGLQSAELWMTRDTRTWAKHAEDVNLPKFVKSETETNAFRAEVMNEGIYGFTILLRSGVGLMQPPPHNGDQPQVWVEVDLTKPAVHYVKADVNRGADSDIVTITWKATDKNLGREPISISYFDDDKKKWVPIGNTHENTGTYVWAFPKENVPYKFNLKVTATDLAGNVGETTTSKPVTVDLHVPKSQIFEIETDSKPNGL